jgi:hypothetical protein
MIVQSDFLTHWKVKALANRVGMEAALTALLALWAHCERRRAWEFELTPLMLAGICDFKGDAGKLFTVMLELKLLEATDSERWYQVHEWGKVNAALAGKWVANKGKGWRWHPRGYACQSIDPSIDQAIERTADRAGDTTIGLDRIGEDRIGETDCPDKPGGAELALAAAEVPSPESKTLPPPQKKKGAAAERPRDAVFDALLRVCGLPLTGLTKSEGGRVATAKKQVIDTFPEDGRDADTVTREIERRAARMRAAWGERVTLTPTAIAANWSQFDGPAKKEGAARVTQGITEPEGDWKALLPELGLQPVNSWAMLERADKVRVLRKI